MNKTRPTRLIRTVINYYLPEDVRDAKIAIIDANGRMVKTVSLTAKGNGQFVLEGGQLAAGTHQYSLIVNEKAVDTKNMVLLR